MERDNSITVSNPNSMNIVQRVKSPTPMFFKTLRTIGLALATAGGAHLAAPIALPAAVISIASYIALAGCVMAAVSQTAVDTTNSKTSKNETS